MSKYFCARGRHRSETINTHLQNEINSRTKRAIQRSKCEGSCKDQLPGQSFVQSGCGRGLLQDKGHSWSRPHSFPGYPHLCFGMFPERFRSASVSVGSEETRLI